MEQNMRNITLISILSLFLFIFSCNSKQSDTTVDNYATTSNTTSYSKVNTTNPQPLVKPAQFQNIGDLQNKLRDIAENKTPSVVFISTEKIVKQKMMNPFDFFGNDPFFNFGPKGRHPKEREFKQKGLGSGVIYKKKGSEYFIITNNHVVDKADTIEVTIDQSKIYKGKVVGSDPAVDLAVVKIETKDQLQIAQYGDSSIVKVGDFVLAIGNPYGLNGTMTFGIVSALGRTTAVSDRINLTHFIQTDAAINPGNSGGPLINIQGEVIGINTMIYSQSGGNVGIGFAIPVNIVKSTVEQIIEKGKVDHGYLGVYFKILSKDDMETLGLEDVNNGVMVTQVIKDSPADKYGIKTGDIILEVNGKKIKGQDLAIAVGTAVPGTKLKFKVLRNKKVKNLDVKLGIRDDKAKIAEKAEAETLDNCGIELVELSDTLKRQYNIPNDLSGVIISDIAGRSRAASMGLRKGDLIFKVNNLPVKSISDLKSAVKKDQMNFFFIYREGTQLIVSM